MAKANALDRFISSADVEPERFYIPTSLVTLNLALRNMRGFQSGRMLEIVGTESTGKSTLALDIMANAQRLYPDKITAYLDAERTYDRTYASAIGVNSSKVQIIRSDTAENGLAAAEMLARQGASVVVIDSVNFLIPAVLNDDESDNEDVVPDYDKPRKMAALGTLLGDWCKRMTAIIDYHNTLLVFINQYRANFSTMSRQEKKPYGPYAYKHALTWRIELARIENKDTKTTVRATISKNKLGAERGIAEYDIVYGKGLDAKLDLLQYAVNNDIVRKSGAWYYFKDQKAQGERNAADSFDLVEAINEHVNRNNMV